MIFNTSHRASISQWLCCHVPVALAIFSEWRRAAAFQSANHQLDGNVNGLWLCIPNHLSTLFDWGTCYCPKLLNCTIKIRFFHKYNFSWRKCNEGLKCYLYIIVLQTIQPREIILFFNSVVELIKLHQISNIKITDDKASWKPTG